MIIRYLLRIAGKVRRVILLLLIVLMLFTPFMPTVYAAGYEPKNKIVQIEKMDKNLYVYNNPTTIMIEKEIPKHGTSYLIIDKENNIDPVCDAWFENTKGETIFGYRGSLYTYIQEIPGKGEKEFLERVITTIIHREPQEYANIIKQWEREALITRINHPEIFQAKGPGKFIIDEGLKIYGNRVHKQKQEQKEIHQGNVKAYEDAKKNFTTKRNRMKKKVELKKAFDKYKDSKMTRKELIDFNKFLDRLLEKDLKSFLWWGEYYNMNHEIQDKIISLYDKKCIEELNEYLENPAEYKNEYTWQEKAAIKVGLWILYSESEVEGVDREFHLMLGGSTYDNVKNWLNVELAPLKEHNQKANPIAPTIPIAPGL